MFLEGLRKGMGAPDPGWMPFVKLMFGFFILAVLAGLATIIAIGKIKAETSFGLDIILGGLLTLSGGFAGWAFRDTKPTGLDKTDEGAGEQAAVPPRIS
jgi:thiol:disulfide interchange protein